MKFKSFVLTIFFILIGVSLANVAAAEPNCDNKDNLNFCIDSFETNKNSVTKGDITEGKVVIKNIGNESGDAVIIIGLESPDGDYKYHRVGEINDIRPGETQPYEFQLSARDSSTVGEHRINVRIMDPAEKHLYDATGYTSSIYIKEDSISIGWLINKFNRVTVGVSALITILAFIVGRRSN